MNAIRRSLAGDLLRKLLSESTKRELRAALPEDPEQLAYEEARATVLASESWTAELASSATFVQHATAVKDARQRGRRSGLRSGAAGGAAAMLAGLLNLPWDLSLVLDVPHALVAAGAAGLTGWSMARAGVRRAYRRDYGAKLVDISWSDGSLAPRARAAFEEAELDLARCMATPEANEAMRLARERMILLAREGKSRSWNEWPSLVEEMVEIATQARMLADTELSRYPELIVHEVEPVVPLDALRAARAVTAAEIAGLNMALVESADLEVLR